MKAEELRKLSEEDLKKKLMELKEELFRLRFQIGLAGRTEDAPGADVHVTAPFFIAVEIVQFVF